ncbi:MAG: HIT family protein [Candidatus Pacebacteria bacterium]|nr:HIT family protein [Candidatus Paceibacterota bacterium]
MSDCIFCKIVKGEVSSYRIYENDKVLAFLDKNPTSPGHLLVIPKDHYENLEEISENFLAEVVKVVKIMGQKVKEKLNYPAYNVIQNNGKEAGQIIDHLHFHVLPRKSDDGLTFPSGQEVKEEDLQEIQNKLIR